MHTKIFFNFVAKLRIKLYFFNKNCISGQLYVFFQKLILSKIKTFIYFPKLNNNFSLTRGLLQQLISLIYLFETT